MTHDIAVVLVVVSAISIINYIPYQLTSNRFRDKRAHIGIISDYLNEEDYWHALNNYQVLLFSEKVRTADLKTFDNFLLAYYPTICAIGGIIIVRDQAVINIAIGATAFIYIYAWWLKDR